jgi:hypothetical protein
VKPLDPEIASHFGIPVSKEYFPTEFNAPAQLSQPSAPYTGMSSLSERYDFSSSGYATQGTAQYPTPTSAGSTTSSPINIPEQDRVGSNFDPREHVQPGWLHAPLPTRIFNFPAAFQDLSTPSLTYNQVTSKPCINTDCSTLSLSITRASLEGCCLAICPLQVPLQGIIAVLLPPRALPRTRRSAQLTCNSTTQVNRMISHLITWGRETCFPSPRHRS